MPLNKRVHITRRFLRSIRIDSDLGDTTALEGFVCPQSSADILSTMARHVSESGQGAFTWTGPYGSGKSSLVVALGALLASSGRKLQGKAAKIFGRKLTSDIHGAMPTGSRGWRILPVVARRDSPVAVIGEAMKNAGLIKRLPRGGWTGSNLITALTRVATEKPRIHGGLILFIDEMGKFLEAAVRDSSDIYLFQQLAEAASRSKGRFLIVGVLHQNFEEYAHRLSSEIRDEWAKIQGRFIDLIVHSSGEEQINLISRAIESDHHPKTPGKLATDIAHFACNAQDENVERFANTLEACWPLHPVVACLLGPISRRRFGQSQRSIFGFLSSSEPHGFQDFLLTAQDNELYTPDQLWDYLRVNLEPTILASPDGHRWALATEVLERCESSDSEELHIKLLKTIAVVDLFKERSGIVADTKLLLSCFHKVKKQTVEKALKELGSKSLTVFRKFTDSHAIFAGSDFDINEAIRIALGETDAVDFDEIKALAGFQPILAKRHYGETGALRWFDVSFIPVSHIESYASEIELENGVIGHFLLAIPTEGEDEDVADAACQKAARYSSEERGDIVVGISSQSWTIMPLARELSALKRIDNSHPELAGDAVARREVAARLAELQILLEDELYKAFRSTAWFRKNHSKKPLNQEGLNILASELADRRFGRSPILHNELLNRQKPSTSAITAQNKLLHRMLAEENKKRLGIEGFPAEGGLFICLLESTGLHKKQTNGWRFGSPLRNKKDPHNLKPIWKAAYEYVKTNSDRTVAVSEIYDLWRKPPFGVKDGVMPILVVAFMLSQRDKLAIYREGIFRARFDDVDVDYLTKDATIIQLRWMDLSSVARRLLSEMAQVVRGLDGENELENLEPIDVGRGLVAIYDKLPKWTARTEQLSSNASTIRSLFKKAHDPNQFLFDDIPGMLGKEVSIAKDDDLRSIVDSVSDGLEELVQAYPLMLHRLRDTVLKELQVPNTSSRSLDDLHDRAKNIQKIAGDFRLDAYINRLSLFDGSDESFEGIASLAANKPPRDWTDPDLDKATIELVDMSQKFLRAETFARVKGRRSKRHAMAVVVGMNNRPVPLLKEFDISDSDRANVDNLMAHVTATLKANPEHRNVILAALAELSARYMQGETS
ncbi:MAG: ATP-binding protein [Pseudohongiellaceae bacterium]